MTGGVRRQTVNKLVRLLPEEAETLHRAAECLGMTDTQLLRLMARQAMFLTVSVVPALDALEAAVSDRDAARDAYAAAVRSYEELGQQRRAAPDALEAAAKREG